MIANSYLRLLCFSVLVFVLLPASSIAVPCQIAPVLIPDDDFESVPDPGGADVDRFEFAQTLFTDRKISLTARSFREELQAGDSSKALAELSRLQIVDPQLLVPMANGTWGPLFLNVIRDFELLPGPLRNKVLSESSAAASRRLAEILSEQDFEQLPRFLLRYAGTKESIQALVLMSRLEMDRGQYRSAAIWLQVVAESFHPEYVSIAEQQLKRLAEIRLAEIQSSAAGPDLSPDQGAGTNTGIGSSDEAKPEFPEFASWVFRPSISPSLADRIDVFRESAVKSFVTPTSPWAPAIGEERIYQRTMRGLAAISLNSGEMSWHYPISPILEQDVLKERARTISIIGAVPTVSPVNPFASLEQSLLANLFCRDEVQTRPVTANGRVFLVTTDSAAKMPSVNIGRIFGGPLSTTVPFRMGQLIALDAKSGRRIWTVGRATLEQHLGSGDFGVWFYGPPCVTDHVVLSIFEWKGEIRLGRFSVETGQYLSSAVISLPEQTIDKDSIRTLWACTPVRDGGLLWTTTTTGWLFCLDETTLSVLWASRLTDESSLRSTVGVGRGRVAALTAQAALNQRWNRSELKLVGDRMLVLSQEAYEAILVDSQTGRRVKTIPVSNAVLIHADDDVFVLSNRDSIECFSIQDGQQIWKRRIFDVDDLDSPSFAAKPTGLGALKDGNLLLPLSTGYLAKIDLKSGKVKRGGTALLPVNGWGSLVSTADDRLLYVSVDQVLHLSDTKPQKPVGEHLQSGRELLASGDCEAALREARQVAESDRDFRSAQNLIFQCLLQLARTDSEKYLRQLKATSKTEAQRAEQLILETELQLDGNRPVEAISLICDVLKMPTSVIHAPTQSVVLKDPGSIPESPVERGGAQEHIDLTIRTWATELLKDLLVQVDEDQWPVDDLKSVPLQLLPGIRSLALAPLMKNQIGDSESRQLAFQLLQRAVQLKSDDGNTAVADYQEEVELLDDFLRQVASQDEQDVGISLTVLRRLMSVAIAEMPASFVDAVRAAGTFEKWSLVWPDQLHEQLLQAEREWHQAWDSGDWSAVPIRRRYGYLASQGRSGRVSIADQKDPFLNQYLWHLGSESSGRRSSGRLFSSVLIGDKQFDWSLPLTEQVGGSSTKLVWIYRSGTILLLRSVKRLTAVSLLDQEVLWSISVPEPSSAADNEPFQDFLVLGASRPGTDSSPSWRILSSNDACVCTQESNECQARDLLTGNLLWKASLTETGFPVVAGPGHTLLFSDSNRTPLLVDVASGKFRVAKSLSQKQMSVIHHNESKIVIWNYLGDEAPGLIWVDPLKDGTQQDGVPQMMVSKTVALKQFEYFQFLNASTLAAINSSGDLRIVDLSTGDYQDYQVPFSKSKFPTAVSQPFIAANSHYLYVGFPRSSRNFARFGSSVRAIEFEDELFVLDRKAGGVTAKVASKEPASLNFQDPRFPMILVTTQPNRDSQRGPLSLRCFGMNGKQLQLEGRFPFESSVRSLDYRVNRLRSFDLVVNGASFRIEAAGSVSASDSDE